ncbi:MAG: hypothetical protein O7G87_24425 [bacterium]|nr:hypothetical protein [bacterium]
MKKMIYTLCLALMALCACGGDDNPADSGGGRVIVDQSFELPGTSFQEFTFSVDTDVQQNVRLQGQFEVTGGNIQVALMNRENFESWQRGETPQVLYGSGSVPGSTFLVPIESSGFYFLVFSNTTDTASKSITTEVRLLISAEDNEG